jgi:4-phosphopantoate--beta-alanine ligase
MPIPKSHPRYHSLILREKLAEGIRKGLVHETGLIAHGRGEAFDYLIGERTIDSADKAAKVGAALLLNAENPVISLNGNTVALSARECISLASSIPAKLEVNLFHRTEERVRKIVSELKRHGAEEVYGERPSHLLPGLNHDRALCERIYDADVVLVPLEDGDRCEALKKMGKKVIAIDLNPLSRTARTADVTIVDNIVRAIPNIERWVSRLKGTDFKEIIESWDNESNLKEVLAYVSKRLNSL